MPNKSTKDLRLKSLRKRAKPKNKLRSQYASEVVISTKTPARFMSVKLKQGEWKLLTEYLHGTDMTDDVKFIVDKISGQAKNLEE